MENKTSNAEYGSEWLTDSTPSFADINNNRELLRNLKSEIAREHGRIASLQNVVMDTAVRTRPFNPEEYNIPKPLFESNSPLYLTSNSVYGRLKPSEAELPFRYVPKRSRLLEISQPITRSGLVTTITRSRINDILDHYY